jgi:hypothetical protein
MAEVEKPAAPDPGALKKAVRWILDRIADRFLEAVFAIWLSGDSLG